MTRPTAFMTVMIPIVTITLMAISTITRRSSKRGATKRTSLFQSKRCAKRRANYPPASIDAKAWFILPKSRAAGSSFRLSASAWISQLATNGMAEHHGPGSSPSERMMEWMEPRCMRFLTDAVMQRRRCINDERLFLGSVAETVAPENNVDANLAEQQQP